MPWEGKVIEGDGKVMECNRKREGNVIGGASGVC